MKLIACWSSRPQPSSQGSVDCCENRCSMAHTVPRPFMACRSGKGVPEAECGGGEGGGLML